MRIPIFCLFLLLLTSMRPDCLYALGPQGAQTTRLSQSESTEEEWFGDEAFEEVEPIAVSDPIEPFNRAMFWVNDKLYFYLLKPVARAYRIVPESGRVSVGNFFTNLATPVRLVNALLQGKFADAGTELGRFALNTTVGAAGLFDPARSHGLKKKGEDFGQTLGHYRVGGGAYLVLPILGPANLRDGVGRVADLFLDPLYYLGTVGDEPLLAAGMKIWDKENDLSLDKDTYESIKKEQIDPYLFIRDAYTQKREALIRK